MKEIIPFGYDLYRLIDIFQNKNPNATPLGKGTNPRKECIKIRSSFTLAHKSSAVQKIDYSKEDNQTIFHTNLLSISGLYGPLPDTYGEIIQKSIKNKNPALQEFLDIFSHRLISLLYKNYRHGSIHTASKDETDNFVGYTLHCLTGLTYFEPYFDFERKKIYKLHQILWRNIPSSSGLKRIIQSYFQCLTSIEERLGDWIYPSTKELSYLGKRFNTLGRDYILGHKSWDTTNGITIKLGPLNWQKYLSFIPPLKQNYKILKEILSYYLDSNITVYGHLKLDPHEAKTLRLGNSDCYLNYTTWLVSNTEKVQNYEVNFCIH